MGVRRARIRPAHLPVGRRVGSVALELADGRTSVARRLLPGRRDPGLYDLAGNVWEWTTTLQGGDNVLKGGSFSESNPAYFRSAVQLTASGYESHGDFGFRCAKAD